MLQFSGRYFGGHLAIKGITHPKVDRIICGEIEDDNDNAEKIEKFKSVVRDFLSICKAKNREPCIIFLWITPNSGDIGT